MEFISRSNESHRVIKSLAILLLIFNIVFLNYMYVYSTAREPQHELLHDNMLRESKLNEGIASVKSRLEVIKKAIGSADISLETTPDVYMSKRKYNGLIGHGVNTIVNKKYYLAFSVYENSSSHLDGALENIALARHLFPNWAVKMYYLEDLSDSFKLEAEKKAKMSRVPLELVSRSKTYFSGDYSHHHAEAWSYEAFDDPQVDVCIVRRANSRLILRDRYAVNEWLASEYDFHTMRDNVDYPLVSKKPILEGMWGGRKGVFGKDVKIHSVIEDWIAQKKDLGQFLNQKIWPIVSKKTLHHDADPRCLELTESPTNRCFPMERHNADYVGMPCANGDFKSCEQLSEEFIKKELSRKSE